jgi:hypothetical protein
LGGSVGIIENGLSVGVLEGLVTNGDFVGDSIVGLNVGELVTEIAGVKDGGGKVGVVVGDSVGLRVGDVVGI